VSGAPVLLIDGVDSHAATTTAGNITTVLATLAAPGMSAGTHTATLVWSDTAGHNYSEPWSFTVGAFPTLWAALSSPVNSVDTTKPGFVSRSRNWIPRWFATTVIPPPTNAEENNGLLEDSTSQTTAPTRQTP